MKIKDLIKELEYFDSEDEIGVYAHDKDNNIEYAFDINNVGGDIFPILILDIVRIYKGGLDGW